MSRVLEAYPADVVAAISLGPGKVLMLRTMIPGMNRYGRNTTRACQWLRARYVDVETEEVVNAIQSRPEVSRLFTRRDSLEFQLCYASKIDQASFELNRQPAVPHFLGRISAGDLMELRFNCPV